MASLVTWLKYSGARKIDGTPVASGRAFFYEPGTTSTQIPVYSQPEGFGVLTQPVALDAAGRATVYINGRARIEVQEAVTNLVMAVSDLANTVTAQQVEVLASASWAAQPLNVLLDSLGSGGTYKESAGATVRSLTNAVGGGVVTLQDFGAVGDDATDCTAAINAALTRAAQAHKEIRIEPGTYRFSTSLIIGQPGTIMRGVNVASCVLKNMGSQNGVYVLAASGPDNGIILENFTVTAAPVSSNSGVMLAGGDGTVLRNIRVMNHRIGINTSPVSIASIEDCVVHSTDGNAAGVGIAVGPRSTALRSRVLSATLGKAFTLDVLSKAIHCHADAAPVGFEFIAGGSQALMCQANACTTGFLFSSSDAQAMFSSCMSCGTGFSIGAVARSGSSFCGSTDSSTADLATAASSSEVVDNGNTFSIRTLAEYGGNALMGRRGRVTARNRRALEDADYVTPPGSMHWVPDPRLGELQVLVYHSASLPGAWLAVDATAIVGLTIGQHMTVVIANTETDAGAGFSYSFAADYKGLAASSGVPLLFGRYSVFRFVWAGAHWCCISSELDRGGATDW